jgi:hypothetical protein
MEEHKNLSHAHVPFRKEAERGEKKLFGEKTMRSSLEGRQKEQKTELRAPSSDLVPPPPSPVS